MSEIDEEEEFDYQSEISSQPVKKLKTNLKVELDKDKHY